MVSCIGIELFSDWLQLKAISIGFVGLIFLIKVNEQETIY